MSNAINGWADFCARCDATRRERNGYTTFASDEMFGGEPSMSHESMFSEPVPDRIDGTYILFSTEFKCVQIIRCTVNDEMLLVRDFVNRESLWSYLVANFPSIEGDALVFFNKAVQLALGV